MRLKLSPHLTTTIVSSSCQQQHIDEGKEEDRQRLVADEV